MKINVTPTESQTSGLLGALGRSGIPARMAGTKAVDLAPGVQAADIEAVLIGQGFTHHDDPLGVTRGMWKAEDGRRLQMNNLRSLTWISGAQIPLEAFNFDELIPPTMFNGVEVIAGVKFSVCADPSPIKMAFTTMHIGDVRKRIKAPCMPAEFGGFRTMLRAHGSHWNATFFAGTENGAEGTFVGVY